MDFVAFGGKFILHRIKSRTGSENPDRLDLVDLRPSRKLVRISGPLLSLLPDCTATILLVMVTTVGVRLVEGGRQRGLLVVDVGRGTMRALPVVVAEAGFSG